VLEAFPLGDWGATAGALTASSAGTEAGIQSQAT
jgi:hypothetical protein